MVALHDNRSTGGMRFPAFLFGMIAALCTFSGCISFDEGRYDVGRGVPITVDDIPEGAISAKHRNALHGKRDAIIERWDDGGKAKYRIEFPTGELWWIDASGEVTGGVI